MDLSDEVMRRAKKRAADDGVTLREIVERALRQFLEPRGNNSRYKLRWTPERGKLLPGVDIDDRDALFDFMDGLK